MAKELILDEEGINCSVCGKDVYHCECEEADGKKIPDNVTLAHLSICQ